MERIRDLYNGISFFKKGYQLRPKIINDEKGSLFSESDGVLARWRKHFSQPMNAHWINDIRQANIYSAGTPLTEKNDVVFDVAIEKLKRHKSPGMDQIPAEVIEAGRRHSL
jgi:hypothetical protein